MTYIPGRLHPPVASAVVEKPEWDPTHVYAWKPANNYKGWKLIDRGEAGVDDASVIQSALDSLTSGRTWKETVVLIGDFIVSQTIKLPSYTVLDLTQAKIKLSDDANVDILTNSDSDSGNVEIEILGGVIDGNKANQTAGQTRLGIVLTKVTNFKIDGTTVKNVGTSDSNDIAKGIDLVNCERGEIISVYATANNHYGIHLWECKDIVVRSCFSYGNERHGFGGSGNQDCKWIENYAIDNLLQGFWFRNLINCLIKGNHAISTDGSGEIGIQIKQDTAETTGVAENNEIVDNVIVGFRDSTYGHGIYLQNHIKNTLVKGNVIRECRLGALLVNAHYTDIVANKFVNNTERDILDVDGSSTSIKIANNYLFGCKRTSIETNCKYGKIAGNYIKNAGNEADNTYYGIYYRDRYYVDIKNNTIESDATNKPAYGIYLSGDYAHHIIVKYNRIFGFATAAIGMTATFGNEGSGGNEIKFNEGYTTENSGTATITSGATSVTVSHGLVGTPAKIIVTPITPLGSASKWWVTNITDTSFDIVVDSDPAQDVTFAWQAEV